MNQQITPITEDDEEQTQPRLTIDPQITAPDGSFYVFDGQSGYRQVVEPWAVADHIEPTRVTEQLGDVESWCQYVTRFAGAGEYAPLLTWSQSKLRAVLDYPADLSTPGRRQWIAEHAFLRTRQFTAWEQFANGRAHAQRELIEFLEDRATDVQEPDAASLVGMLRVLRGTVNATANAELDPNGGTRLEYTRATSTSLELPPTIVIGIPVLKGHTAPDADGVPGPVTYRLDVRVRVSVADGGKLEFRLTIPDADHALELAVTDRVMAAQALLDEGERDYEILRAAS